MTPTPLEAKAWRYTSTQGGMEKNLKLETITIPTPKADQHLVRVLIVGLNLVDYKLAEAPIIGTLAAPRPAIPGLDLVGEIVVPAVGSGLQRGQIIVGSAAGTVAAAGGLAEYAVVSKDHAALVPEGVSIADAASLPTAAITAYQAIQPYVKAGDRIFYNGGSGGVGVIAIQIAKILGCHITVTCSSRNVEFCRSLGADEVIDYTKIDVLTALKRMQKFDLSVDGVGNDHQLYWKADQYTKPNAKYIYFAVDLPRDISFFVLGTLLPTILGGGKRKLVIMFAAPNGEQLERVVGWMKEGKVKAVIEERYSMKEAPAGFAKLRLGRTRGKILVDVASE